MSFSSLIQRSVGQLLPAAEIDQLCDALQTRPRRAIRLCDPEYRESIPFRLQPVPWSDLGYYLAEPEMRPSATLSYGAGNYYIQDAASLLALSLLNPRPGELICDLCAAPGGKATAITSRLGRSGFALINEPVGSRLPPLTINLARNGASRYLVSSLDPESLANQLGPLFDAVLVDAPCSGQSLVQRKRHSEQAFAESTVAHSAARQRRILDAAIRLVRPGGRLIYSTCTFAEQENEAQIARLLATNANLVALPAAGLAAWRSSVRLPSCYRIWPHREQSGGAFAAAIRKEAPSRADAEERHSAGQALLQIDKRAPSSFSWGEIAEGQLWRHASARFLLPSDLPIELITVAKEGPWFSQLSDRQERPAYGLAMRSDQQFGAAQKVAFTEREAKRYLSGEVVPCGQKGWLVVQYNGQPLGWAKADGLRAKNHLPKSVRLRF